MATNVPALRLAEGFLCYSSHMDPEPAPSKIEPIDRVLVGLIVFFTTSLIGISKWSPNDGQTFQVLSGALTTILGAFVGRMMPNKKPQPPGVIVSQVDSNGAH